MESIHGILKLRISLFVAHSRMHERRGSNRYICLRDMPGRLQRLLDLFRRQPTRIICVCRMRALTVERTSRSRWPSKICLPIRCLIFEQLRVLTQLRLFVSRLVK